eukprot:scaffold45811_cov69-Phaeocystis_antarctica.AAC.4
MHVPVKTFSQRLRTRAAEQKSRSPDSTASLRGPCICSSCSTAHVMKGAWTRRRLCGAPGGWQWAARAPMAAGAAPTSSSR